MMPIILSIGSWNLYSFGFLAAIGYLLAAFIAWRRLREIGFKEEKVIDLTIIAAGWSLIFSRLFYVLANWSNFKFDFISWINLSRFPGLTYSGAMVGFLVYLYLFSRKEKWNFWQIGDEMVYAVLPALILLQVGAFLTGGGQGKTTVMPWGIFFPGLLVRRQPIGLFLVLGLLGLWFLLLRIEREWRFWSWLKNKSNGFVFQLFMAGVATLNLMLAFFKENQLYWVTVELIINLCGLMMAIVLIYRRSQDKVKIHGKK